MASDVYAYQSEISRNNENVGDNFAVTPRPFSSEREGHLMKIYEAALARIRKSNIMR